MAALVSRGEQPQLRMIDGELAFPDEVAGPDWREVRLQLSGGMVTLRRSITEWTCTVWGTDDPALLASRDACVQAIRALAG